MTKRWLSLVLVLTLMSTLFTGVAFAAEVQYGFVPATSNQAVVAGERSTVVLGELRTGVTTPFNSGNSGTGTVIDSSDYTTVAGKLSLVTAGVSALVDADAAAPVLAVEAGSDAYAGKSVVTYTFTAKNQAVAPTALVLSSTDAELVLNKLVDASDPTISIAATRAFTFRPTSAKLTLSAGEQVKDRVIGTILANNGTINNADWQALLGKVAVTGTGFASTPIAATVDENGSVKVTFIAKDSAVTNSDLKLDTTAIDTATADYTNISNDVQVKVDISIPVTSLVVKQKNSSGSFVNATSTEIETGTKADEAYYAYVGALPTSVSAGATVIVKSSDPSVVTIAPDIYSPDAAASALGINARWKLTGIKPGTADILFAVGGFNKKVTVTVQPTNMTGITIAYTGNAAGNKLAAGSTLTPTLTVESPSNATEKEVTYIATENTGTGAYAGQKVVDLDPSTGMITALVPGTAKIMAIAKKGTARSAEVTVYTDVRNDTAVAALTITPSRVDGTSHGSEDGTNDDGKRFTRPMKFTIATATANTSIYYTLNGQTPDKYSTLYTKPVELDATQTNDLQAIAIYNGTDRVLDDATASRAATSLTFALVPTKVTLDSGAAKSVIGSTETKIVATLSPDVAKLATGKKEVTWTSSNIDVITITDATDVSSDKLTLTFKAKKAGQTVITAQANVSGSGPIAECIVTVIDSKATSVTLDKTSATLPANEQLKLTATVNPGSALSQGVTWTSSDTTVATVAGGVVTAATPANPKLGQAVITATTANGNYAACVVTVVAAANKVATPTITVLDGTTPVSGTTFAKVGYTINVASSTTSAELATTLTKDGATVSPSFPYTMNDNGTYVVTAIATKTGMLNSDQATATFVVSVPVEKVTIKARTPGLSPDVANTNNVTPALSTDSKKITFAGVGNYALTAEVKPDGADVKTRKFTWKSSNPDVAVIYDKKTTVGDTTYQPDVLYAIANGTATITATSTDAVGSKSDTVAVAVNKVLVIDIALSDASVEAGQFTTLKPSSIAPDAATNKKLTWEITSQEVANPADGAVVATIEAATGKLTGVARGTATVVAKATDGSSVSSNVATVTVTAASGTVAAPTVKIDGGADAGTSANVTAAGKATLASATVEAAIYYTTNGDTPAADKGTLYNGEFQIPSDCVVLKAIAIKDGKSSAVKSVVLTWNIPLEEVKLTPSKATVAQGEKFTIAVEYVPANATNKDFNITALNPNFTLVKKDAKAGLITLKANANAILGKQTIAVKNVGNTDEIGDCDVTVTKVAVTGFELVPSVQGSIAVNSQLTLRPVLTPAVDSQYTWVSDNTKIASVTTAGVVKGEGVGTATITATSTYDPTKSASYTVNVKAAPAVKPDNFTAAPTLSAIKKSVEVQEDGSATVQIAKFDASAIDTINYYYTPLFTLNTIANFDGAANLVYNNETGIVSLVVKNASPAGTYSFSFTWSLWAITDIQGNNTNWLYNPATGYSLTVNAEPSQDEKDVTAAKAAVAAQGGAVQSANAATEAEAKAALLAALNSAIAGTGITLTADDIAISNFVAAEDGTAANPTGTPGSFSYTVNLKKGDVTETVIGTGKITPKAFNTKAEIKVASSTTPYEASYKKKPVYVLAIADGTVTFSVPGYTATGWKSSKTGLLSIDANGVATLKKGGATRITITATLSDGTKVTQLVMIRKIADTIKLQYKSGKKWFDFSESNPLTIGLGAKKKVLTRVVAVTPSGAKLFAPKWAFSDPTIAFRGSKNYINGSVVGETNVTCELYNGVKATGKVIVSASKTADLIDELDLDLEVIEELETEEIEEIVEVEDDQEIEDVEVIEEIEETEAE